MGLDFRKKTGKIVNGSRLIVLGQIITGQKLFSNSFNTKSNPYLRNNDSEITVQIPQPTIPTNTPTFSVTPTPTSEQLDNPIITENR